MSEFAALVRSMRKAKDMTLQSVADRVGVRKGYISSMENDKVNPPAPEVVKKLAKVLGIDKVELLLLAYIQKAPHEIQGILLEGAKRVMGERKAKSDPAKLAAGTTA